MGISYVRWISTRDGEGEKSDIDECFPPKNDGSRPLLAEISRMLGFIPPKSDKHE